MLGSFVRNFSQSVSMQGDGRTVTEMACMPFAWTNASAGDTETKGDRATGTFAMTFIALCARLCRMTWTRSKFDRIV